MYGIWCMKHYVWTMTNGIWCIEYDVWNMTYETWCMEYDVWNMLCGIWHNVMEYDVWKMTWKMTYGIRRTSCWGLMLTKILSAFSLSWRLSIIASRSLEALFCAQELWIELTCYILLRIRSLNLKKKIQHLVHDLYVSIQGVTFCDNFQYTCILF